ncbi:phosphonoacetaldehyde hydrolase [Candidatus Sororendozoicomonas aggregata]|uniref:phosphonoacetaldehyde hydrolase n=1 Tax=Candidatus Sororendozoicomonas aggregata TaxID=3073239 RepID=UPI002ED4CF37
MIQKNTIEAVIFDWAGTVVDFGSWAPTSVFVEAFKKAYDFDVSLAEARVPMGLGKWDHIKTLGQLESVDKRWQKQFNQAMVDSDVDTIYNTFMPLQKQKVSQYADLIPGALETINKLREEGIKIGSCTGYPREVMDILIPEAARKGYKPDSIVACDDLKAGARPGPWMALQNVINLGVTSVSRCVKVDDSSPGITEGLNAGMWTVGLTLSGNEAGFTLDEYQQASESLKEERRQLAADKLLSAGAHYVVDTIEHLPAVLNDIQSKLVTGTKP